METFDKDENQSEQLEGKLFLTSDQIKRITLENFLN